MRRQSSWKQFVAWVLTCCWCDRWQWILENALLSEKDPGSGLLRQAPQREKQSIDRGLPIASLSWK
jgi:hypothetical protein